jgi:hypothetical protein
VLRESRVTQAVRVFKVTLAIQAVRESRVTQAVRD